MRKIISALLAFVLLTTSAFAGGWDGGRQGGMAKSGVTAAGTKIRTGLPMNGLLSYKNAIDNPDVPKDLDYSLGSATNTLTVSRDSTHPATYFDGNGVMQVTTTSDTARRTRGYYDETGWHSAPGWLLEGASTNLVLDSYFANGTSTYWSVGGTGAIAVDNTYPNLYGGGQVLKFTGSANSDRMFSATAFATGTGSYTVTVNIRGSGTIRIMFYTGDTGTQLISGAITLSNTQWTQQSYTFTNSGAGNNSRVGIIQDGAGSVTAYLSTEQCENQLYPSSFIPTTTAALTRNAETTNTYTTAGNFPAPSGGNCLSFDGANASGDDYVSVANSATGNQVYGSTTGYSWETWCFIRSDGEGDGGRIIDKINHRVNVASQSGSNVAINATIRRATTNCNAVTTVAVSCNVWHHIVVFWDGGDGTGAHAPKIYIDNVEASYTGTPTGGEGGLTDDSSAVMYIGNQSANDRTFDGFIQSVRIYRNKALSSTDVTNLYNAGRGTAIANIPSVTGCTAEYLFNEGTGTTLTDSVAGNNGTISGATWSKDTMSGSVMIKYRPVMLPSEQDASYKQIFSNTFSAGNEMVVMYYTNANNYVGFRPRSNYLDQTIVSPALATWTRYASHTLIATWSTTANESSKKLNLYIDGSLLQTSANFVVPAGALPTSFSLQSSAGQAAIWEEFAVWNRVLTQAEVTQIQNRS